MFLIKHFNWHIKLTATYRLSYYVLIRVRIRASASVTSNINHFFAAKTLTFSLIFWNIGVLSSHLISRVLWPSLNALPQSFGKEEAIILVPGLWHSQTVGFGFLSLQPSLAPSTLFLPHFLLLGLRHASHYQPGYGLSPSFSLSALYQAMCGLIFWNDSIDFEYF